MKFPNFKIKDLSNYVNIGLVILIFTYPLPNLEKKEKKQSFKKFNLVKINSVAKKK